MAEVFRGVGLHSFDIVIFFAGVFFSEHLSHDVRNCLGIMSAEVAWWGLLVFSYLVLIIECMVDEVASRCKNPSISNLMPVAAALLESLRLMCAQGMCTVSQLSPIIIIFSFGLFDSIAAKEDKLRNLHI